MSRSPEALPLTGIVVADFSRVLAGPLATMTLADLGARVIKIERPGEGDDTRHWGPPFTPTGSTYFDSVNRNKESIELDLTIDADRAVAVAIASNADVLVENFRPGGMASLGLGYETLSALNPRLIYASISGFGSGTGAGLPGYDFTVQALGGLMSITGEAGGPPMKVGVAIVDVLTAKDATIGILAALQARHDTGLGRLLEVNLLSSLQGALANQGQAHLGAGVTPRQMGNVHPSIAPYELLNCQDRPLVLACGNDRQFGAMLAVLGLESLGSDERFLTNRARVEHRPALVTALESRLATQPAAHWQAALSAVGVPAGQVGSIADGVELARSLDLAPTIEVQDASGTPRGSQFRSPITWTPAIAPRTVAPPTLGEHNGAVRRWLADLEPRNRK
jgi:crotonobetainyl-CoA:carnitine CoA-transferase CaiB-like acyl-CoA transferase